MITKCIINFVCITLYIKFFIYYVCIKQNKKQKNKTKQEKRKKNQAEKEEGDETQSN